MNKIKGIAIGLATIIIIVIMAGIYKFNYLAHQPEFDVDGNEIENTYRSEVLLKWFNFNTSNDFAVRIPNTNIECKITELIDTDSLHYAKGNYIVDEEKGEVLINNSKIITLNQSTKDVVFFVIPFSISNQGSGLFKYLGTFKLDFKDKTFNQIDSYFLGDRIKIKSITYDGINKLQVELNIHSNNQSMSETPSELKILELKVNHENLLGLN